MSATDDRPMLTIGQIAERIGLQHVAIRRAIDRGELTAYKVCGRIRVYEHDYEAWVEAGKLKT